ncbi:UNVERIFIED_CONTAM: hypothetical protein Slati_2440500 [Sesamum latifolium]|uniref:Uncharacterized protein n=1 Tax=Sesamum latifolium TaxID=2727402 RepID=A0AAW2WHB3_9LAMI
MGGRLQRSMAHRDWVNLSCEHLGFESVRVRSFRLLSPGLGLGHGIGCRFPSWTRRLCLLLETMLRQIARHRNLLSYSANNYGHSFSKHNTSPSA